VDLGLSKKRGRRPEPLGAGTPGADHHDSRIRQAAESIDPGALVQFRGVIARMTENLDRIEK